MLGVTTTNHLSAGEHVRGVIVKCAQSLHALKLLSHRGMREDSLRVETRLQGRRPFQAAVCITGTLGFYQCGR